MTPRRLHALYRAHFERKYPRREAGMKQEKQAAETPSLYDYLTGRG